MKKKYQIRAQIDLCEDRLNRTQRREREYWKGFKNALEWVVTHERKNN